MSSGRWRNSPRVNRLPEGWKRRVRPAVFAAYGTFCHICGGPGADTVDHVVAGDDHSIQNLRPAHENPCHRRKSAQEGVEAAARRRAQAKHPTEDHPGYR